MNQRLRVLLAGFCCLLAVTARAVEATWNYAVQVNAVVQEVPARITLHWVQQSGGLPQRYTVYRKIAGATEWGEGCDLPGTATEFVDAGIAAGKAYEYQIVRRSDRYAAYGYVEAGIAVPLIEHRGKMILLVERSTAPALWRELEQLEEDLAGDGWTVLRHDVSRTDEVGDVKRLIKADYDADPTGVKAVFLFGRIPVPYAGWLNPDGHTDHKGAWPSDAFYGDMDGSWTDSSVDAIQADNSDPADAARLSNVPGDGKFDQTALPSTIELQVGRVDLSGMPGKTSARGAANFPSETELLRQYLKKDHDYRCRVVNVARRALVGDYFGVHGGEAFAASGYRNFAPLVGADQITNLNLEFNDRPGVAVPALAAGDYLFAYGCGAGSYRTMAGLGDVGLYHDSDTVEFVDRDVRATFMLMFGSWFGDWDREDSFLRAPLATRSSGLVSVWSGRPHWFIHPMGLGETVGAAARLTQNNHGLYRNQRMSSANLVHAALMGDPSLRLYPVAPPASLDASRTRGAVHLTWSPSPDPVEGYHVYRAASPGGPFVRLNAALLAHHSFSDRHAPAGAVYMVRAIKLETSPSGSFYNPSQGVFWRSDRDRGAARGVMVAGTVPAQAAASPSRPAPEPALRGESQFTVGQREASLATSNVGTSGRSFSVR